MRSSVTLDDSNNGAVRRYHTYDEENWKVLRERWDDLRAQLHGMVISPKLAEAGGLPDTLVQEINSFAPRFDEELSD